MNCPHCKENMKSFSIQSISTGSIKTGWTYNKCKKKFVEIEKDK